VRVATQYAPARCTPDAVAQLQPIPYACGAQRALLPGAMNINELMNINDVRESATISPRPCKLIFDLLTLKVVSKSRVTWATCMPIMVFLGLAVLESFPMYATDRQTRRQTDRRQTASSLNTPPRRAGHNNNVKEGPFLFQRLSIALQRFNAILLHETFDSNDDPEL